MGTAFGATVSYRLAKHTAPIEISIIKLCALLCTLYSALCPLYAASYNNIHAGQMNKNYNVLSLVWGMDANDKNLIF